MKPDLLHIRQLWFVLLALLATMTPVRTAMAQTILSSSSASDCNSCDGTLSIAFPEIQAGTISVISTTGAGDFLIPFNDQNVLIDDICVGAYSVEIEIDGLSEYYAFSLNASGNDPGDSGEIVLCSDNADENLFNLLGPGAIGGGTWNDPNGTPQSGILDPGSDDEGLYTYSTDVNGCISYAAIWVDINEPANTGISTTYLICETYVAFNLYDVMFGNPDPNGTWFLDGVAMDGIYDPEVDVTDLYVYEIDTVPGCDASVSTLFVVENSLPNAGMDSEVSVCPGPLPFNMTDYIDGNPDTDGQWFNELDEPIENVFDPASMPEGSYLYQVIGATPCPTLDSYLTVTFTDGIDAGEGNDLSLCETETPFVLDNVLNGNPDPGGIWLDPNGLEVDPLLDPISALSGPYTYLVEAIGCVDETAVVDVQIEALPEAGEGIITDACEDNGQIDLNDFLSDEADLDGVWFDESDQEILNTIEVMGGDQVLATYFVQGLACPSDEVQIQLSIDEAPISAADVNEVYCENEDLVDPNTLVPDPGTFEFQWVDSEGQSVFPIYNPGLQLEEYFQYSIFSGNSCPNVVIEVNLSSEPLLAEDVIEEISLCSTGPLVFLDDQLPEEFSEGGEWFYNDVPMAFPLIDPEEQNEGEYSYSELQTGICPAAEYILVANINVQPSAGLDGDLSLCENEEAVSLSDLLSAEATPGGEWTYNGNLISELEYEFLISGTLIYTAPAMDPCPGDEAQWPVEVLDAPAFEAGSDISICSYSDPIALGDSQQPGLTYHWSPEERLSDPDSSDPMLNFENPDNDLEEWEYIVEVSNGICTTVDTVQVDIYPLPQTDAGPDQSECDTQSFELLGSGADSYEWLPFEAVINQNGSSAEFLLNSSSWVYLLGSNQFGCEKLDSAFITINPLPEVEFNTNLSAGCPPLLVELENTSVNPEGTYYQWQIGGETFLEDSFTVEESGTYDVSLSAISSDGCFQMMTISEGLEVYPSPLAHFEYEPETLNVYDTHLEVQNFSEDAEFWEWSIQDLITSDEWEPEFDLPSIPGTTYMLCLDVYNDFGCHDQQCRSLEIEPVFNIYIPNAFSPNDDGRNEVFQPVLEGFEDGTYIFQIFDRWGEMIFESDDPNRPWIGNVNGGNYRVPPDIYIWQLFVRNAFTGENVEMSGHVTVIR